MSASFSANVRSDSFSKIWRVNRRRPRVDVSDETSDESDGTQVQPGISGKSDLFRCEVCVWRRRGLALVRSKGTIALHSCASVGLRGGRGVLCVFRGEPGGLSDTLIGVGGFCFRVRVFVV